MLARHQRVMALGAVVSKGWEREVMLEGVGAKRVKTYINQKLISPSLDAQEALAAAGPVIPDLGGLFEDVIMGRV